VAGCLSNSTDGAAQISAEKWLGGNGTDSLWHLVSFPGQLSTYDIDEIFRQFSGLAPSVNSVNDSWRLYKYQDTDFTALTTNDPTAAVEPGRGYWFRHFQALDTLRLDTAGAARTWATIPAFEIHLDYGWNLIGSPYLFPAYINDTLIDRDSISSFLSQAVPAAPGGSNWWSMSDVESGLPPLQPWRGYVVWCENPGGYSISLDPHYVPAPGPINGPENWVATVSISTPDRLIGRIEIGISSAGNNGPDLADVRSIAFFGKSPSLGINNAPHGSFLRDIRSSGRLQIWRLDMSAGNEGRLTFSWSCPAPGDRGKSIILYDAVTGGITDMLEATENSIENASQLPEGRFCIIAGDNDAVKEAVGRGLSTLPSVFQLYQNYPNPFNPATAISYDLSRPGQVTVDLFNILGQRVERLVDAYQQAGSYRVIWDGRNMASGVYLYRLHSSEYSATRKMILLK